MYGEKWLDRAVSQDLKRVRRIRARPSYQLFKGLYGFLRANPCTADILRKFYEILDKRCSFGSRTHAASAAESLEQVLKDNKEVPYVRG
jgi:hypothetical protein